MDFPDYRDLLKEKISTLIENNKHLSLRSIAKRCSVSHTLLIQVVNKQKNLSKEMAVKLTQKLSFGQKEREHFLTLLEYQTTKNEKLKEILFNRLLEITSYAQVKQIDKDQFPLICNWYYWAILELTKVPSIEFRVSHIARILKVDESKIEEAIERLFKLKLIKYNKQEKIVKSSPVINADTKIPDSYFKEHHSQMMRKSHHALYHQPIEEREISGITVAINKKSIPEIKDLVNDFKRKLSLHINQANLKDAVYQFNIQFFNLTN